MYSVWNGEEVYSSDVAIVASTGRARVASTFAYVTGFSDFTTLVPALLLSLGLDSPNARVRSAGVSRYLRHGGRRPDVRLPQLDRDGCGSARHHALGFGADLYPSRSTRVGCRCRDRACFPSSLFPRRSRASRAGSPTRRRLRDRFEGLATLLPPLAITEFDYPFMGIGTGMQQNARASMRIETPLGHRARGRSVPGRAGAGGLPARSGWRNLV